MARRAPLKIIRRLKTAREAVTFEKASFGFKSQKVRLSGGTREMTYDDFIKGRTAPYRHSWILPELDRVIAWAEGRDDE